MANPWLITANQASTLLNLQSSQTSEQGYVANNNQINTYLTAYDATLAQLQSDGTTLQKTLSSTQAGNSASLANLATTVQGLLTDVTATLNTQVGDRYLYSGTRYGHAAGDRPQKLDAPYQPDGDSHHRAVADIGQRRSKQRRADRALRSARPRDLRRARASAVTGR